MKYEYRNIDTDIELFKAARAYWTEEHLTKQDIYDILSHKCYTPWEADRAISDYYYVYIYSPKMFQNLVIASCINVLIFVLSYWVGLYWR